MSRTFCILSLSTMLLACSNIEQRNPAPQEVSHTRDQVETNAVRYWGDVPIPIEQYVLNETARRNTFDASLIVDENGKPKTQHHLIISGGGASGAFGAGLLNAMSDNRTRPEYRLVTGISTGAILGLYAFLGEEYDHKIREFYTELSDEDLYQTRSIWQLFSSSSLLNTKKFEQKVREEVDGQLLAKVKSEHLRGRTFLVKTTNLDSQRPVIWNMGAIALSDSDDAEYLFESVLIASAAIPGIFEPVLIPTKVNGKSYDEMHVDGGVVAQAFFLPEDLDIDTISNIEKVEFSKLGINIEGENKSAVWVINNARIGSSWQPIPLQLTDIMGRSISTMIKYQGRNNLTQIYQQSQLTGSSFHLLYIDDKIPSAPEDAPFSQEYMQYMYCYGYTRGLDPRHWLESIPQTTQLSVPKETIADFDWSLIEPDLPLHIERCLKSLNQSVLNSSTSN